MPAGFALDSWISAGAFVAGMVMIAVGVMAVVLVRQRPGLLRGLDPTLPDGGVPRWLTLATWIVPIVVVGAGFTLVMGSRTIGTVTASSGERRASVSVTDVRVVLHTGGVVIKAAQTRKGQDTAQAPWAAEYPGSSPADVTRTSTDIHIPAGRPTVIEIVSNDAVHSFRVPGLLPKVDLVPGMVSRLEVEAADPGVYRGECAEEGGLQHAHVPLVITVDPPDVYVAWLAAQHGGVERTRSSGSR